MELKGKAIQVIPSRKERKEIENAAKAERRSLASFALVATINAARVVNGEKESAQ